MRDTKQKLPPPRFGKITDLEPPFWDFLYEPHIFFFFSGKLDEGELFDCVISNFTIQAAARDRQEYGEIFKRIAGILNKEGILVFTEGLEDSWYVTVRKRFKDVLHRYTTKATK